MCSVGVCESKGSRVTLGRKEQKSDSENASDSQVMPENAKLHRISLGILNLSDYLSKDHQHKLLTGNYSLSEDTSYSNSST